MITSLRVAVILVSVIVTISIACGDKTQARSTSSTPTVAVEVTSPSVVELVSFNLLFDKESLSAPANAPLVVRLVNKDGGVLHNLALYRDESAKQTIFNGELLTGPKTLEYKFTAPAPGTYFFRCDIHPETMTGVFTFR